MRVWSQSALVACFDWKAPEAQLSSELPPSLRVVVVFVTVFLRQTTFFYPPSICHWRNSFWRLPAWGKFLIENNTQRKRSSDTKRHPTTRFDFRSYFYKTGHSYMTDSLVNISLLWFREVFGRRQLNYRVVCWNRLHVFDDDGEVRLTFIPICYTSR